MEHPENHPVPAADRGRGVRSGLLAAGAAFGMTLAGLGIAGAQTSPTPTPSPSTPGTETSPGDRPGRGGPGHPLRGAKLATAAAAIGIPQAELLTALRAGQSIAQVAESKNVAVSKVVSALVDEAKAHLAAAVTAGRITQALADEKAATLTERATAMVNRTGLPGPGGPGRGHHGPGAHARLSTAAAAIGITEADLVTALRSGQSIAQVAESRNVAVSKVVTALVDEAKAHLAGKVAAGDLTQAQADEKTAALTERVTEMVNRTGGPGRGPGPRGLRPGASAAAPGGTASA